MFFKKKKDLVARQIDKANLLFEKGESDSAFQIFSTLQKDFPENTDVLFGLAILQNSTRQHNLAINTLKHILSRNSDHESTKTVLPSIIYEYAVQLSEGGKKELARQYLLDFIDLENDNKADLANGYKELAVVEESLGNMSDAKKFITAAIALNAKNKDDYAKSRSKYFKEIIDRLNGS